MKGLEHKSYEEQLRELRFFSWRKEEWGGTLLPSSAAWKEVVA